MSNESSKITFEWLGCLNAIAVIVIAMISLSAAIGFSIWIIRFIAGI